MRAQPPIEQHHYAPGLLRPSHVLLRNRATLSVAVLVVVVQGILAAFAHPTLLALDRPLSRALAENLPYGFFRVVTEIGRPIGVLLVALVAAWLLRRRCRAFAASMAATAVTAVALDVALKLLVSRPRPGFGVSVGEDPTSFPSGHVMLGTLVLGLLVPTVYLLTDRRWAYHASLALFFAYVPVVALSRVVIGAHWPTDVIGSLALGFLLLLFAERLAGRLARGEDGPCRLHAPAPER